MRDGEIDIPIRPAIIYGLAAASFRCGPTGITRTEFTHRGESG